MSCPFRVQHRRGDARTGLIGIRVVVYIELQRIERRFDRHHALQGRVGIVGFIGNLHRAATAHGGAGVARRSGRLGESKAFAKIRLVVEHAAAHRSGSRSAHEPDVYRNLELGDGTGRRRPGRGERRWRPERVRKAARVPVDSSAGVTISTLGSRALACRTQAPPVLVASLLRAGLGTFLGPSAASSTRTRTV